MRTVSIRRWPLAAVLASLLLLTGCAGPAAEEHLERAVRHREAGELSAAVIELKNALRKDPELAAARQALGELYLRTGDAAGAVKELERARRLGVPDEAVLAPLLRARLATGTLEEAEQVVETVRALPEAARTGTLLALEARAELRANRPDRARALLERAVEVEPDSVDAQLTLAQLDWDQGDRAGALARAAAAVEAAPERPEARRVQAELLLAAGEAAQAAASFEEAIARDDSDALEARIGLVRARIALGESEAARSTVEAVLARAPGLPAARYLSAVLHFQGEAPEAAEAELQRVFAAVPDHLPSLFLRGLIAARSDRPDVALADLERVVARQPGNLRARLVLASVHEDLGDPEAARDVLEDGLSAAPEDAVDAGYLAALGQVQLRSGATEAGLASLAAAAERAPDAARIRAQLGVARLAAGETANAEAELQRAVDLSGEFELPEALLVLIALEAERLDDAEARARAFVEAEPELPMAHNLLGAVALARGDAAGAEAAFRQAIALDPAFAPAHVNLALLAGREGDREAARAVLENGHAAAPTSVGLLERLTALELEAGRGDAALERLRAAREAAGEDAETARRIGRIEARLQLALGRAQTAWELVEALGPVDRLDDEGLRLRSRVAVATGRGAEAVTALEQLRERRPDDASVATTLAQVLADEGDLARARRVVARSNARASAPSVGLLALEAELALRLGRNGDARGVLGRLRSLEGGEGAALALEGDLALAEQDWDTAAARFRDVLALRPDDPRALRRLHSALRRGERPGEARAVLERWLEDHPQDDRSRLLLADHLLALGDHAGAEAAYERLREGFGARQPVVLNNLAWLYGQRGDPRALETAEAALALAPDAPAVLDTHGWLLLEAGRPEEALVSLRRAAEALPSDPSVQYHLAEALARTGARDESRRTVERALALGRGFPEEADARALLARLGG